VRIQIRQSRQPATIVRLNFVPAQLATASSCRRIGTTAERLGYASLSIGTRLGVLTANAW